MPTRDNWSVGVTTGYGILGAKLTVVKFRNELTSKSKLQYGDLHGKIYADSDAAMKAADDHGYSTRECVSPFCLKCRVRHGGAVRNRRITGKDGKQYSGTRRGAFCHENLEWTFNQKGAGKLV